MLPRKKLDIGWMDLLSGMTCCLRRGNPHDVRRRIEKLWSGEIDDAMVCLSVRSGFDLLLHALALPKGSEILVSAVTIRDMVRIIEEHGLVPVPVDLDMKRLAVDMESLQRCVSEHSRALVVAHLFGSRMPMEPLVAFAKERDLYLIEDCAQAYSGDAYVGNRSSDVSMFSFGPIKTNTALGTGILRISDAEVRGRMRERQDRYPVQARGRFLKRLIKYVGIKLLLTRAGFTAFVAACRLLNKSHDDVLSAALRGFAGPDFFRRIRTRPSYPQLALLERKLKSYRAATVGARTATAQDAARRMQGVPRPGSEADEHTHWVYPIQSTNPDMLMRLLWKLGLDATKGASSLFVVEPPAARSELVPHEATSVMQNVLYLPVYPEAPVRDIERLARAVETFEAAQPGTRSDDRNRSIKQRSGAPSYHLS